MRAAAAAAAVALPAAVIAAAAPKRGLALKSGTVCADLALFSSLKPWFYGWGSEPSSDDYSSCAGKADSGFVPMTWGKNAVNHTIWASADALLGFNEPNHKEQSNISPEAAAAAWPGVEAAAQRLGIARIGSPAAAPCGGGATKCIGNTDDWFTKFFAACSGCQVDFLATHTYTCTKSGLSSFLSGLHTKYGRPIWLTEFNCGDGGANKSAAKHMQYMEDALPVLEGLAYVERYSWMSARNTKVVGSSLITPQGGLTALGKYYRDYSPAPVPPPAPTPPPPPTGTWKETKSKKCAQQHYLSQHGTLSACEAAAIAEATCTSPKTVAYEAGTTHNCYCSNATCAKEDCNWLDLYVQQSP